MNLNFILESIELINGSKVQTDFSPFQATLLSGLQEKIEIL